MKINNFAEVPHSARIVLAFLGIEVSPYQDTGLCWGVEIPPKHEDLFEVKRGNKVSLSPWGIAVLCDLAQRGLNALEKERAETTL